MPELLIVPRGRVHCLDALEVYPREYEELLKRIRNNGKSSSRVTYPIGNLVFNGTNYSFENGAIIDIGEIASIPVMRVVFPDNEKLRELERILGVKHHPFIL